jgi:hypothetical protein
LPDVQLPIVQYQKCRHNGRLVAQPVRLLLPKSEAVEMEIGTGPSGSDGSGGSGSGGSGGSGSGEGGEGVKGHSTEQGAGGEALASQWVSVLFQWCKRDQLKHPCCDDVNSCYRVVILDENDEDETNMGAGSADSLRVLEIRRPASCGGEDLLSVIAKQQEKEPSAVRQLVNSTNVVPVTYTVKSAAGGFYLYM